MALVTEPLALTICGSIIHLHPFPLPDKTYGVVRQEEAGALRAADRRDERLVLRLVLAAVADTEEVLAVDEVLPAGGRGPQAGDRDGQEGRGLSGTCLCSRWTRRPPPPHRRPTAPGQG